jgi:diguanylate cyclase
VKPLTQPNLHQYRFLEPVLTVIVFGVSALMGYYAIDKPILLHLFYVPVVLTASASGRYRGRVMALLCILSSLIIFLPNLEKSSVAEIPMTTLLVFSLWGCTLVLIGDLVGSLSDRWRSAMAKLTEAHKKDVLTDALTGVANRRAYEFELTRRIANWNRNQASVSLILLDIDYFKKFNDRYGHQAGDAVLKAVANALQQTIREVDLVARYGGEEFAVVLTEASVQETKIIAERIRSLIESSRFPFNGLILRLTVSVGFSQILPEESVEAFIERADAALYSSKEAGRNCVHYHDGQATQQFGQGIATEITATSTLRNSDEATSDPYTDDATGLPTQKVFLEELRRRSAERNRYGSTLSLAIIKFGGNSESSTVAAHARKSLLATISKLTSSVMRDTDLIARYQSNCLGVLMPSTELQNALKPLIRLRTSAANYCNAKYSTLNSSVSIGVVDILPDEQPGAALQRVEAALQVADEQGGNCVYYHNGTACLLGEDPAATDPLATEAQS